MGCMLLCYALAEGCSRTIFFPLFNIANLFTLPLVIFACEVLTKTEKDLKRARLFCCNPLYFSQLSFIFLLTVGMTCLWECPGKEEKTKNHVYFDDGSENSNEQPRKIMGNIFLWETLLENKNCELEIVKLVDCNGFSQSNNLQWFDMYRHRVGWNYRLTDFEWKSSPLHYM